MCFQLSINLKHSTFITLSHVLEHVHDPARLIEYCYTLLTPGGRLWFATSNSNRTGLHMLHQSWMPLHPLYHLVILSQHALLALLKQAGFCNIHMLRRGLQSRNLWHKSTQIAQREGMSIPRAYSQLIRGVSELAATLSTRWGEETVVIAHKPQ
jgi:2-polyprenyl-3-methyl-5-hydroxy-6-metoxy-1,4-benzoquinol methylase